ncbi:MAG: radical SAM protein [Nanoarchaeota archaeon]
MLKRIRKFLSPNLKKRIMHSLQYRVLERLKLKNHKINFSCELTTKCNAICNMCTRKSLIKNKNLYIGDMDKEIINKILQEMKKFHENGKRLYFSPMGLGEPLLFIGLFDLFKKIKNISKKIEIVLVTNGILLNKETSKKLVSLGVDEIIISLNANNPKDYEKIIGVNVYEKVIENIKELIKIRNQSNKKIPRIYIQYLDYKNNPNFFKQDIKNWLKLMKYNDKCFVHSIANQAGFYFQGNKLKQSQSYPCTQPLWRIAIKINGDIYPCDPCFYSGKEKIPSLYLGNILTTDLYKQFSKNSKRLSIVEDMKKNNYSKLPNCKKCNTYKLASNNFFKIPKFLRGIFGKKWL